MMLKRMGIACCLLIMLNVQAMGQIRLGLDLSRRSYIIGEVITATVRLESQSREPLVFGEDANAELFMEISGGSLGSRGMPVRRRVSRDMVVMPGNSIRDIVEITSLYTFLGPGNYRANAVLVHEGRSYRSQTFAFDVNSGIEMRSFRQTVPGYRDREAVYSFRYASRDGREEAFMVIQSPDGRSLYGTFSLGPLLRMYRPVIRARDDDTVVVVHQSGNNRFSRSIFEVERTGAIMRELRHFRPDGTPINN